MAEDEGGERKGGGVIFRFLCVAALSVPGAALAQSMAVQPGAIEEARAIVARMHIERTLDPLLAQLMPLMTANIEDAMRNAADTPAALKARLSTEAGRQQIGAIISEEFGAAFRQRYPDIEEAAAVEYGKAFSESELAVILSFYRSPVGTKLLLVQPQLQKALSEAGRGMGRDAAIAAFPKIQARIVALDAPAGKAGK